MLGKPEWFTRRKYGGWGLFPKTWQGWLYVGVFIAIMFGTQLLPLNDSAKIIALGVIVFVLAADTIDMMRKVAKDERERLHEAIAERNALWTIVFILGAGIAYQAAQSIALTGRAAFDPVIIIAVLAGLVAKALSNIYLDRKD